MRERKSANSRRPHGSIWLRVVAPAVALSVASCGSSSSNANSAAASGSGGEVGGGSSMSGGGSAGESSSTNGGGGSITASGSSSSTGSGGSPPAECDPFQATSGTRVRARYQVAAEGGACVALPFLDTALGQPCTFQRDDNGDYRCFGGMKFAGFADAECTEMLFVDSDGTNPDYGTMPDESAGCWSSVDGAVFGAGRASIYDVMLASKPVALYRLDGSSGAQCVLAVTNPTAPAFYRSAGVRAPDGFVKGTPRLLSVDAQTDVVVVDGDDGSSAMLPYAVIDHARQQSCTMMTGGSTAVCQLDGAAITTNVFADEACSVLVGIQSIRCGDEPPPIAVAKLNDPQMYAIGDELAPDTLYRSTGAGCVRLTDAQPDIGQSTVFYAVGAPLPGESFITIPSKKGGTGRLRTEGYGSSNVWAAPPSFGFDTAIPGAHASCACDLHLAADGTTRCVPGCVDAASYFADDHCTKPLTSLANEAQPIVYLDTQTGQTFHQATSSYSGPVFTEGSGNCVALSSAPPKDLHATELAPDAFVRVFTVE